MPFDLFIPSSKLNGAIQGQKAVAKVIDWDPKSKNPVAEIINVLGYPGLNETEMHAILAEFELPYHFTEEVEEDAEKIPAEINHRRDIKEDGISGIFQPSQSTRKMQKILMMHSHSNSLKMATGKLAFILPMLLTMLKPDHLLRKKQSKELLQYILSTGWFRCFLKGFQIISVHLILLKINSHIRLFLN